MRRLLALGLIALAAWAMPDTARAGDEVLAAGSFHGKSGHATTGGVRVLRTADGLVVELGPDFTFDGAPDPKLGFGRDGYDADTKLGALRANSGAQRYAVPKSVDPGA